MSALRRRHKTEVLTAMADPHCLDCGDQLTTETITLDPDAPRCRDCSYRRRGEQTQLRRKVLPLRTSAQGSRTSAPPPYRERVEAKTVLRVIPNVQTDLLEIKAADVTPAPIVQLPVRAVVPPPSWDFPELEERALKVSAWWQKRTGRPLRRREAWQAAGTTFPLNDLLSALERIWRHAKANGFEARTLKPLWSDLREAEAAFHKRGAAKSGRGGMKSLTLVLAKRASE